jgi:hypothetical protein
VFDRVIDDHNVFDPCVETRQQKNCTQPTGVAAPDREVVICLLVQR